MIDRTFLLAKHMRRAALVAVLAGLVACSATFTNHGYVPPPEQLAQINVGDTREAVIDVVGQPTAAGVVREEAWFYTQYRVRNYTYNAPEVIERDIVAISFSASGRVTNIERFGLEDGRVIQLSRRVTESSVQDATFFAQILQNFGRIDLGNVLGQ